MRILHTEASGGFGGQEIRILREAEGMRLRGHEVIFAVKKDGGLVTAARAAQFVVYELDFTRGKALSDAWALRRIIGQHQIELINTHSSWDAWVGGIVGRMTRKRVLRTRHLSTPIRKGINSRLLYRGLADQVVTTCEETADMVRTQAGLCERRCLSIPTGVSEKLVVKQEDVDAIRMKYGLNQNHIVVGTVCVLRSWKGVQHLLEAASLLRDDTRLRWLIVGSGPSHDWLKSECFKHGLEDNVIFTGHLSDPLPAMAAMDIFALLSIANEGVSQAVLQAAYLSRPLITTSVGGLGEVCLHEKTGLLCPVGDSKAVSDAIQNLSNRPDLRIQFGHEAQRLVMEKFTLTHTLDAMEKVYQNLAH